MHSTSAAPSTLMSTDHVRSILLALQELKHQGKSPNHPQVLLLLRFLRQYQLQHGIETKPREDSQSSRIGAIISHEEDVINAQIAAYRYISKGITVPHWILPFTNHSLETSNFSSTPILQTNQMERRAVEEAIQPLIRERIKQLETLLDTLSADHPSYLPSKIELKQLQQRDIQRSLRKRISDELEMQSHLNSSEDIMKSFKHALYQMISPEITGIGDKVERPKKGEQAWLSSGTRVQVEWLQAVMTTQKLFFEFHAEVDTAKKKFLRRLQKYQSDKEKRASQYKERLEKERLAALKRNDEAEYLKLLQQTKNKRLMQLIKQTDQYLEQIGAKVIETQSAANAKLAEFNKVETIKTEDTNDINAESLTNKQPAQAEEQSEAQKPYYSKIHSIQEEISKQPSILIGGELKEYQMDGLTWLVSLHNNRLNGILADEMGLGKTIQTIALICHLVETKKMTGPFLIVVPLTTISNWALEFKKWAPTLYNSLVVYKGTPSVRKRLYQSQISSSSVNKCTVCLTTFDFIIKDRSSLSKVKWGYVIVDEGHRMKNHNCKLSTTLARYYESQFRIILTGTPLQNSLPELWSLLNFLLPTIFHSVDNFEQWFNKPFESAGETLEMNEEEKLLVIQRLHKVLRPFLLRRLKSQVEAQLPEKVERVIKVDMSAWQKRMYDNASRGVVAVGGVDGKATARGLLNSLMQLRKVCDHPYMFNEGGEYPTDDMIWRSSGKVEFLDRTLPKLKASGHRILIFSQFTTAMNVLEVYFRYRGYTYMRLDGSTKAEDRGTLLEQFNAPDSPYFIFILSTRAGGLGLNLQTADTVILFDSDWNPQADLQAQDRAHRIGQKNNVLVLRLVTINSIEEKILESANYKLDLDSKIIQAGMFNKNSTATDRRNFLMNLLRETDNEGEEVTDIPDNKQINQMISRSDQEYKHFQLMDKEFAESEKHAWLSSGHTGPIPPRLLQDDELPDYLRVDLLELKAIEEATSLEFGRGRRQRSAFNNTAKLEHMSEEAVLQYDEDRQYGEGLGTDNYAMETTALNPKKRSQPYYDHMDPLSQMRAAMSDIWQVTVCSHDNFGRLLSGPFMDLPTEDLAPGYYSVIRNPISFNQVKDLISTYTNMDQFRTHMLQIFSNAHIYNVPGSQICLDAEWLQQVFLSEIAKYSPFSTAHSPVMDHDSIFDQGTVDDGQSEDIEPFSPGAFTETRPAKFMKPFGDTLAPPIPAPSSEFPTLSWTDHDYEVASDDGDDDGFADKDLRGTGSSW